MQVQKAKDLVGLLTRSMPLIENIFKLGGVSYPVRAQFVK
jgi:hypothetical protein